MQEWYERNGNEADTVNRDAIADLQQVLQLPYGYRFVLRLLLSMGAEGHCPTDEGGIALRNKAEDVLIECEQASHGKMMQLISDIRSLRHGRNGNNIIDRDNDN